VTIGGAAALTVTQPDGTPVTRIAPGEAWRVIAAGQALQLVSPSGRSTPPAEAVSIIPEDQNDAVRSGRRDYRGSLDIVRDRTGLSVINRVGLEDYLGGVVGGEMGRRDSSEMEALRAQAVVSRTYALRNMGRWRADGFDFYATVADQVYGGVQGENALALQAVRETRGQVITAGGAPIDAFFFSTCGGRTADGTEAFRGAERPYLRSIADVDRAGVAYCSISPRYHWRDEWSGDALQGILDRTLRAVGLASGDIGRVRNVATSGRTASGRVAELVISTTSGTVRVDGPRIRRVLETTNGEILRSTLFQLTMSSQAGRISRLVADGSGAGHGVGMCQWGAVGRARAGQRYPEILAAYFQGTQLERFY
jgi:stage II sporulation protein D